MTILAASVMGKDHSVNGSRAMQELAGESRASQDEAIRRLKNWADTSYQKSIND